MSVRRSGSAARRVGVRQDEEEDAAYEYADEVEMNLLHEGLDKLVDDEEDVMFAIRQVVSITDDPTLPSLTFRALLVGGLFTVLGAGMSQLFFYKSNSVSFSSFFVTLVTLPLMKWMARVVPAKEIRVFGFPIQLNPGMFNAKEHVLIAVIVSSGATSAYATDIINIQELFFGQHMSALQSLTLLITTQVIGCGFAGLVYNLLVRPPSMVFPSTLVTVSLFNTLHDTESALTPARMRLFIFVFIAIGIYQFLPSVLLPTLSSVALLCYVHRSKATQVLGSGYKGFGIANLSFDWNVIGATGPLYQPWWAALNFYGGIAGMMYVVMPLLYFSNFWNARAFSSPIGSSLYTANHTAFDVNAVLRKDNTLDIVAWEKQKPMLLTPFFAISYGIAFTILTSTISHVLIWHGKDIKKAWFNPVYSDIHNQLMQSYPLVPLSWYLWTLFLSLFAASVLVMTAPLQFPLWALLMSVGMSLFFLVPIGILKAISDTSVGLNVITEFVAGILIPGKPIGNVCWKCYGYMSCAQALNLISDLKLSHYMKINPRHMFIAQLVGTVIGCFVNYAVICVVLDPANGYRAFLDGSQVDPSGQWDGRKVQIFRSASIIWGAVGPAKFFTGPYKYLYWGFPLGFVLPLIPWYLHKRAEKKRGAPLKHSVYSRTVVPIFLHGTSAPPAIPTNIILTGFFCAYLSQKWARERMPDWFHKFNYVLSAALDAGASVNALCAFLLSITVFRWLNLPHVFFGGADVEHCNVE
ncbi:hypothetical protein MVES1_001796 [Malassezia vespertilionis]|uniref:uncharacterized protein n=1 Tax=Malassezia vespertilionis TaxID=2020962 RepID=UPI0024B225CD|nr:uncharacterized protein MVES1_001796 [Malassezia vespertilionis]WFD06451.1 hypothetical protein MVES1_001796 [Malassezia vespertilionis]